MCLPSKLPSQLQQEKRSLLGCIAVLHMQMWHTVIDRVVWSVGLSVTVVSPAKTAEPMEMPFGLRLGWTQETMHQISLISRGNFEGKERAIVKYRDTRRLPVQKWLQLIEMPFGLLTWMGPRNHVLNGSRSPCKGKLEWDDVGQVPFQWS